MTGTAVDDPVRGGRSGEALEGVAGLLEQAGDDTQERGWVLLADAAAGDDLDQQRREYRTVIEMAQHYHDADLECEARNRLGIMLVLSGLVDEGMVELDESLAATCGGDVESSRASSAGCSTPVNASTTWSGPSNGSAWPTTSSGGGS